MNPLFSNLSVPRKSFLFFFKTTTVNHEVASSCLLPTVHTLWQNFIFCHKYHFHSFELWEFTGQKKSKLVEFSFWQIFIFVLKNYIWPQCVALQGFCCSCWHHSKVECSSASLCSIIFLFLLLSRIQPCFCVFLAFTLFPDLSFLCGTNCLSR